MSKLSLLRCRTHLLPRPFKPELLDRLTQPINRRTIINLLAGLLQERSCLRTRRELVCLTDSRQLCIVLESPVHIHPASLTILYIILLHRSASWTLCHCSSLLFICS